MSSTVYKNNPLNEIIQLIKKKEELHRELDKINKELKRKLNLQKQIIIDYEEWVKKKSLEVLGKLRTSYSIREVEKITGIPRSTIHYRISEGHILTLPNKRIPFEEVVKLVALYK